MNLRPLLALGLSMLALAFGAQAASAATSGLAFDADAGQAVPLAGKKTMVDLVCASRKADCEGKVELVPRGPAAADLGTDPIAASAELRAGPGADEEPLLGLSAAARQWIEDNGPLPVTAELEIPGADKSRPLFVEEVKSELAPPPTRTKLDRVPTMSLATASDVGSAERFEWNFDLKAGTALKLRAFRCPASAPWVLNRPAKHLFGGAAGDIRLIVSDGVGFGSFRDVDVENYTESYKDWHALRGWPEGTLFSNNFFAPLFRGGHVFMSLTCVGDRERAARIGVNNHFGDEISPSVLLPWNDPPWL